MIGSAIWQTIFTPAFIAAFAAVVTAIATLITAIKALNAATLAADISRLNHTTDRDTNAKVTEVVKQTNGPLEALRDRVGALESAVFAVHTALAVRGLATPPQAPPQQRELTP